METTSRWQIAIETAGILFMCSAGVGGLIAHQNQAALNGYIIVLGVPLCAAAFYVALSCFFTQLIGEPRLRFPLTFSLPVIFCSLLPVASLILSTPETGLLAPQETLAYAHVWKQPINIGIVFLGQVIALSLLALLARKRD